MRRRLMRAIGAGVVALVLLAVVAIAALPLFVNTRAIQAWVAQTASHTLGRPVRFASVSIAALPLPTIRLEHLEVAEDPAFGSGAFLTVKEGRLGLRLRPLLSRRLEVADLALHEVRVSIVEDTRGRLNVASLGTPAGAGAASPRTGAARAGGSAIAGVLLSRVDIVDGALEYRRLGDAPSFRLEQVDLRARQEAAGQPVHVEGEGRGQPGGVRFKIRDGRVVPAPSHLVGDTAIRATLDLNAPELSEIGEALIGYAGATGELTGSIELAGTPAHLGVVGLLTAPRLTITSHPASCRDRTSRPLAVEAVRIPLRGDMSRLDSIGAEATVARGTVTVDASVAPPRGTARLTRIAIRNVELAPVLADHLCQPYGVTGPLELDADASLQLGEPSRTAGGSGRFRIGRGRVVGSAVVDLVREVAGLAVVPAAFAEGGTPARSPLDFDAITGSYTIERGVARTEDLVYRAGDVTVRAAGTYGLGDRRVAVEVSLSERGNRVAGFVSGTPGSLRVVPLSVRLQDTRDVRKFLDRLFR